MTSKFWLIIALLHYCCRFYCMIVAIFAALPLPFLLHFLIPVTPLFFLVVRFFVREGLLTVREKLLIPVGNHLEMYSELLGQFAERLMLLNGGLNGYLHLEGSAVLFLFVFM